VISLFSRMKKPTVHPLQLKVDLHSHLIPGIDDGSQCMEESLQLLKKLSELGYEKVITTPHIMADAYYNTADSIRSGAVLLQEASAEAGIPVNIEVAAEYYLDDGFMEHLEAGDVLSIAGKYLLFETSYLHRPLELEEMIFAISAAGYIPLMAHPERYRYIKNPEEEYASLKERGVMMQVNLNSLGGFYGKSAQKNAEVLSKSGMIDFLGSDTHRMRHLESLEKVLASRAYARLYEKNRIQNNDL